MYLSRGDEKNIPVRPGVLWRSVEASRARESGRPGKPARASGRLGSRHFVRCCALCRRCAQALCGGHCAQRRCCTHAFHYILCTICSHAPFVPCSRAAPAAAPSLSASHASRMIPQRCCNFILYSSRSDALGPRRPRLCVGMACVSRIVFAVLLIFLHII